MAARLETWSPPTARGMAAGKALSWNRICLEIIEFSIFIGRSFALRANAK
jgi:hypothetical protein